MSSEKHCFLPLNGVKLTASCQCNKIIVRKPENVKMYMWFNSNIYINGECELGLCFFPFLFFPVFFIFMFIFFSPTLYCVWVMIVIFYNFQEKKILLPGITIMVVVQLGYTSLGLLWVVSVQFSIIAS